MTHDTDCRVLAEYMDDVEEVADLYWSKKKFQGDDKANELGWEWIGGGVGRIVFRVSTEMQEGPVEDATHEAPCVIKFARRANRYDGVEQNKKEVEAFQKFSDEAADPDGEVPLFVPVSDWGDDYRWVSMPEVDADGGSVEDATARLSENGLKCEDLHDANIGEMHGESIVLDYGLECSEAQPPIEKAREITRLLDRGRGSTDTKVVDMIDEPGRGAAKVQFRPTGWILDTSKPTIKSEITINDRAEVSSATFYFGKYDEDVDYDPPLQEATEAVMEQYDDWWMRGEMSSRVEHQGERISIGFQILFRGDEPDADMIVNIYEDVVDFVHEEFPGGEIHDLPEEDQSIELEEGMVLDSEGFISEVEVVDVYDDGTVMVEDEDGMLFEWNDLWPKPREDMLVEEDHGDPEAVSAAIDDAITQQIEDATTRREVREQVDEAITQAMDE